MKNRKKSETIILIIGAIILVVGLLIPASGKLALLDELFGVLVIVCFIAYALLAVFNSENIKGKMTKPIKILILAACVIIVGLFSKDLAFDLISGPEQTVLQDLTTSQYQGYTGIFSSHYYIEGYDSDNNRIKIEVSKDDFMKMSSSKSATVKYFKNTGRALSLSIER